MLEINTSPNKFLPKNNKRLSKVPIIILFSIAVIVLFSIFYVAVSRKQNLEKQATQTTPKEQIQTTTNPNNTNLDTYINDLMQNQKLQANNTNPLPIPNPTQPPIQEIKPQPIQTNNPPVLIQDNAMDEREMKVKKYAIKGFIK